MKVVHIKKEPYDVYIGRPSKWGNPFAMEGTSAIERYKVIEQYREWIKAQPQLMNSLHELKGKVLGCWCSPKPCHGDVLLELANKPICKACNDTGELHFFDFNECCGDCRKGWDMYLAGVSAETATEFIERNKHLQPIENTGRCTLL